MRLVNGNDFLDLPAGTVAAKYEPTGDMDGLFVKGESLGCDFRYTPMIGDDYDSSDEMLAAFSEAESSADVELKMASDVESRWGGVYKDTLFCVFTPAEVQGMITALQSALPPRHRNDS